MASNDVGAGSSTSQERSQTGKSLPSNTGTSKLGSSTTLASNDSTTQPVVERNIDESDLSSDKELASEKLSNQRNETGNGKGKGKEKTEPSNGPPPASESILAQTKFRVFDIPEHVAVEGRGMSFDEVLHPAVGCDGPHCAKRPDGNIWGNRFHCTRCENVDFCSRCVREFANEHSVLHPFIRCIFPVRIERIDKTDAKKWEAAIARQPVDGIKLSHLVVTETILDWVPPSARSFLSECRPSIFAISPESSLPPDKPKVVELDPKPTHEEESLASYEIDENFNITVSYQQIGDRKRDVRKKGIKHHMDTQTMLDAISGRITPYNYLTRRDFYDMAFEKQLVTRLIDIKPGRLDEKMEFELKTVSLLPESDTPHYESLSYTWKETQHVRGLKANPNKEDREGIALMQGVHDIKHAVYCGDEYLAVNSGLFDALQRLRDPEKTRTIWADQVCINQENNDEKSYQVGSMGMIYRLAASSVMWIGEHDGDSRKAFEIINEIARLLERSPRLALDPEQLITESQGGLPSVGSPEWLALFRFFERPIYERAWIIQEFVLPRNVSVKCGDDIIQLPRLLKFVKVAFTPAWIALFKKSGPDRGQYCTLGNNTLCSTDKGIDLIEKRSNLESLVAINGIREDWHMRKPIGLEKLLYITAKSQATDPRDKVYSLLAIDIRVEGSSMERLTPNYKQSVVETFVETARHIITAGGSLGLFGLNSTLSNKKLHGLPSWCPDFTAAHPASKYTLNRPEPAVPFKAHGDSDITVLWPYESMPNLLVTSSIIVDTVRVVSQQELTEDVPTGKVLGEWSKLAESCGQYYRTAELTEEVFCRTVVSNTTFPYRHMMSDEHIRNIGAFVASGVLEYLSKNYGEEEICAMIDQQTGDGIYMNRLVASMAAAADLFEGSSVANTDETAKQAIMCLPFTCMDKKFFYSDGLYIGIGAKDLRPGDEIHILSGAKVPVILRPIDFPRRLQPEGFDEAMRSYHLIGEAYVHGVMNGELAMSEDVEWGGICIH